MHNSGKMLMLIGLLVAAPVIITPFYGEFVYIPAFLIPAVIAVAIGFIINRFAPPEGCKKEWQSDLEKGSVPVLFAWCSAFLLGAVPFVIGGQLSFVNALFESVSGWTTTGLTVSDIANMPYVFLFHRSFMQFCGGLGFILMMIMLVESKHAVMLYNAEGHSDRLMPNIKKTARKILAIYMGCFAAGTAAYVIFGMNLFDAVCHTMSSLSTAGYSTKVGSIGEYNSVPIEIITIVLMLIGASNFGILLLLARRKIKSALHVSELRFMFGMTVVFTAGSAFSLMKDFNMDIGESVMEALFGVVSVYSTTGYSTMDYASWPPFALGILVISMVIGGGTGSTAGGIKLLRTYLIIRITKENIRKQLSPARRISMPTFRSANSETPLPITDDLVKNTCGFVATYIGVFIIGTLLITLTADCSLFDAMFEFASALGTVGISNGLTNANTDAGTLFIEMFGMILGRLEVFIVFIGMFSGARALRTFFRKKG